MRYPTTLLAIFFWISPPTLAAADLWQVDYDNSILEFSAIQEGSPFQGEFKLFRAEIAFDPNHLKTSYFRVSVNTSSVDTRATDRDEILRSDAFFHIDRWPEATFTTLTISPQQEGFYQALAQLRIRDIEKQVLFPFQAKIIQQKNQFRLFGEGELSINRFDFNMAQDDWADTRLIGETIKIRVMIQATQAFHMEATP